MKGVDREATFRHVEFRNLDMNDVKWPESDQHIVLSNYKGCLSRMIEALRNCADVQSKKLQAILKIDLKLLELASQEVVTDLLSICG